MRSRTWRGSARRSFPPRRRRRGASARSRSAARPRSAPCARPRSRSAARPRSARAARPRRPASPPTSRPPRAALGPRPPPDLPLRASAAPSTPTTSPRAMAISASDVKTLRDRTGAGIMDAKGALQEADGDFDRAVEILRVKGQASAAKRGGRAASEGVVASYIHGQGQIGVLVEVNCETDFVARTEQFQEFARDVALHVAAKADLRYVSED